MTIPRRSRVDQFTPAERAIWDATGVVEEAGAHPRLTDAVILLTRAREAVADFVDRIPIELARARANGLTVEEVTLEPRELKLPGADPVMVTTGRRAGVSVHDSDGELCLMLPDWVAELPTDAIDRMIISLLGQIEARARRSHQLGRQLLQIEIARLLGVQSERDHA